MMIHIGVGFPRLKLVSGLQKDNVEQKDRILARGFQSQLMGTGFHPWCLQPTLGSARVVMACSWTNQFERTTI